MNKIDSIKEIMDNFDFEKVHRVMRALGWEWRDFGTPTIEEIKKVAEELLNDTIALNHGRLGGGFRTELYDNDYLGLSFVVEDYDNRLVLIKEMDTKIKVRGK